MDLLCVLVKVQIRTSSASKSQGSRHGNESGLVHGHVLRKGRNYMFFQYSSNLVKEF